MSNDDQDMRSPPETAQKHMQQQDQIAEDSAQVTPEEKSREDHLANKERGGSIAGGGSRDE
jgi:hypothetical protein